MLRQTIFDQKLKQVSQEQITVLGIEVKTVCHLNNPDIVS